MRTLLVIFVFHWTILSFGQTDHKRQTIPLNKIISVDITSIDSTSFGKYILYSFKYKKHIASFWASREDKVFKTGQANVELCRILQMKDCIDGEEINMRGCGFYNGLTIFAGDSLLKKYNFSEYSESPTLRLCTTDK